MTNRLCPFQKGYCTEICVCYDPKYTKNCLLIDTKLAVLTVLRDINENLNKIAGGQPKDAS